MEVKIHWFWLMHNTVFLRDISKPIYSALRMLCLSSKKGIYPRPWSVSDRRKKFPPIKSLLEILARRECITVFSWPLHSVLFYVVSLHNFSPLLCTGYPVIELLLSFSSPTPVTCISILPYSSSSSTLLLILHHLLQGSEMERVKRAISDLMHQRGTKNRAKKHRQGDLESQPLTISGPIIESTASSLQRPLEHSLLIPRREREYNTAVGTVELAPTNDNGSPFKPIHPLQMCAPLVRSHAHSTILHGSKKKQTFAGPRTPNPGVLPMNDLFDDAYDAQENPGRSTCPEDNQIRPITCIPTCFRPPSALPTRSSELLILASIAIAAQNTTPVALPEVPGLTFWTLQIGPAKWTEEEFLVADKILGRMIKQSNRKIVKADLDNRATELLWYCTEEDGCAVTF